MWLCQRPVVDLLNSVDAENRFLTPRSFHVSLVNWNWPIKHCWAQQICRGTQPLSPTFEADASIFGFSNHEGNPCTALNHPSSRSFGNQEGEGERERARQFSPSSPQSETVFASQRRYWELSSKTTCFLLHVVHMVHAGSSLPMHNLPCPDGTAFCKFPIPISHYG